MHRQSGLLFRENGFRQLGSHMHGDYENENMGFCSLKDVNFQI